MAPVGSAKQQKSHKTCTKSSSDFVLGHSIPMELMGKGNDIYESIEGCQACYIVGLNPTDDTIKETLLLQFLQILKFD